jgi:acyl carrier protein
VNPPYEQVLAEIRHFVARHFGGDVTQIDEATLREDIDGWDSVSFAGLMIAVENEYEISLAPEVAVEIETIGDLTRIVLAALASGDGKR